MEDTKEIIEESFKGRVVETALEKYKEEISKYIEKR